MRKKAKPGTSTRRIRIERIRLTHTLYTQLLQELHNSQTLHFTQLRHCAASCLLIF